MEWLSEALALALGFVLLARGAHHLIDGGVALALRWNVRPFIVGLTVVAWGTSLPEVVVSTIAAQEGEAGMALGNVLGSNVANIGLVLGTVALVLPAVLLGRVALRELTWLLGSLALLWMICFDGHVTRPEAAVLLVAFAAYNVILFREPRSSPFTTEVEEHDSKHPWLAILGGSTAIFLGAKLVVFGAEALAIRVGVPKPVIGLSVIALGTSLPELAAGLGSAFKGHAELGLGNVIGSNVFNTLAVIGIAALVRPFGATPEVRAEILSTLTRDFPVVLVFSLVLLALPFALRGKAGRLKGAVLLVGYLGYMAYLFVG